MKREILVVLNPNGFAQAPFLSGVLAFARHHPRLNVTIDDDPATFDLPKLNSYLDEGVDGVIVSETGVVDLPQILNRTKVPIVVFGSPKPCTRKGNVAFVMSNDTGIGIAAARHFFNLGRFRDFAFIPCQGRGWSEKELHGFDAFLKRRRMTAKVFSGSSRSELSDFLRGLNKPAAVMGADDPTALKAVFACRAANLAIPLQVAILGVNDNTVICNGISLTLSSIYVGHENEGYLAAKHLMGMELLQSSQPASAVAAACGFFRHGILDACIQAAFRHNARRMPTSQAGQYIMNSRYCGNLLATMPVLLQLEPNREPGEVVAKAGIGRGLEVADLRGDVALAVLDETHVPGCHHAA